MYNDVFKLFPLFFLIALVFFFVPLFALQMLEYIAKFFVVSQYSTIILTFLVKYASERFDKALPDTQSYFSHLISWDAMHFVKIDQQGYFYEHGMAFLPLAWYIARVMHRILYNFIPIDLVTVGVILNNIYFGISALLVYKVVKEMYISEQSDRIFTDYDKQPALLNQMQLNNQVPSNPEKSKRKTFKSNIMNRIKTQKPKKYKIMYCSPTCSKNHVHRRRKSVKTLAFESALIFILNYATVIFSSFYTESLFTMLFLLGFLQVLRNRNFSAAVFFGISGACRSNGIMFVFLLSNLWLVPIVLLPFAIYQLNSLLRIWSGSCEFKLFIPYSYIQERYWNQGFLKFFTVQQIPNIIIGLPVVLLGVTIVKDRLRKVFSQYRPKLVKTNSTAAKTGALSWLTFIKMHFSNRWSPVDRLNWILLLKLTLGIFTMHWNMLGRFLAFHPFQYIYIAEKRSKKILSAILLLRLAYTILYSAYYPPA